MADFDNIWRQQDETRMAIELELSIHLDEEAVCNLCSQFPIDKDGEEMKWGRME